VHKAIDRLIFVTKNALAENPALVTLVTFSLSVLLISLIGLFVDHRSLNGELVWAKPCKFSTSLAIYGATLIWFGRYLTTHKTFFKRISMASLLGTMVELSAIITQVIRGTSSHFNTSTAFDHAIFITIILAIMPVAFSLIALFVMLLRERNLPRTIGLSLQWGVFLTIIGLIPGVLMLNIHPVASIKLPYLGWSASSGDLRVAHFLGIHALQVLPFTGMLTESLGKRLSSLHKHMIIKNVALIYLEIICLLTWQALRLESVASPGALTLRVAMLVGTLQTIIILYSLKSSSKESPTGNFLFFQKPVALLGFVEVFSKK
jgi:hypothetical protein